MVTSDHSGAWVCSSKDGFLLKKLTRGFGRVCWGCLLRGRSLALVPGLYTFPEDVSGDDEHGLEGPQVRPGVVGCGAGLCGQQRPEVCKQDRALIRRGEDAESFLEIKPGLARGCSALVPSSPEERRRPK